VQPGGAARAHHYEIEAFVHCAREDRLERRPAHREDRDDRRREAQPCQMRYQMVAGAFGRDSAAAGDHDDGESIGFAQQRHSIVHRAGCQPAAVPANPDSLG